MLTELEAANLILSAIGESPVSTLDSQHPDVLSSKLLLKVARYEVLHPGVWFNIESNLTLNPNTNSEIILPSTCLSVDPVDTTYDYVKRGNKLYNNSTHTFIFTTGIVVDMVLDIPFADMPFSAQNYVMYSAAHAAQANFVGDQYKLQNLAARFAEARKAFNAENIKNSDINARNSPRVKRLLAGIRVFGGGVA